MNDSPHKEKPQKLVSRYALISNNKIIAFRYSRCITIITNWKFWNLHQFASPILLIKISDEIFFYLFLIKKKISALIIVNNLSYILETFHKNYQNIRITFEYRWMISMIFRDYKKIDNLKNARRIHLMR